ncbi:amino acid kinase family protein [Paludisphaera rhizosphaerae]|uniref:amino acid kinase family protein n=1 Tax=Paludisphaera rhizosphaerae TaxID=2711216 RepID=UPI0013EB11C6|nr:uridylate kinase [Paludisphaera rhizosphaerae]
MATPAEDRPITVVKVGGSLFDWPALSERLQAFLRSDDVRPDRVVLIAGGGPFADAVRALDVVHGLGERSCHRLALRAMDVSAASLSYLIADAVVVDNLPQIADAWRTARQPILAPRRYLEEIDESGDDPLPLSWQTTSDSIAARIAERLGARRLILLKSSAVVAGDRVEAARLGLVDSVFPHAARRITEVEYVAFRQPHRVSALLA